MEGIARHIKYLKKYRHTITILLAVADIVLMVFYEVCDTSCSYLQGDIFGIDLKWIGVAYMLAIIGLAAFKQTPFDRVLLATGLGVEVHLFAFQVQTRSIVRFVLLLPSWSWRPSLSTMKPLLLGTKPGGRCGSIFSGRLICLC